MCKICWRIGSSFSVHNGVLGLKVVFFFFCIYDSVVVKSGSAYPYLRAGDIFSRSDPLLTNIYSTISRHSSKFCGPR